MARSALSMGLPNAPSVGRAFGVEYLVDGDEDAGVEALNLDKLDFLRTTGSGLDPSEAIEGEDGAIDTASSSSSSLSGAASGR